MRTADDRPRYRVLADDLAAAGGGALPSESELVARYGVSRGTVRRAFAALAAEGVVSSRQGARRVAVAGPPAQSLVELRSFSQWARSLGAVPSGRLVSLERRPATADEPGVAEVHFLTRVRLLDGVPVMIERTAYPPAVGDLLDGIDVTHESITERLEQAGFVFAHADHALDAVAATAADARLLDTRSGHPLLRVRRRTVDPAGAPLEWSEDRYLGESVTFAVRNSAVLSRRPSSSDR